MHFVAALLFIALLLVGGCTSAHKPPPAKERPIGPPLIDARRGGGSIPLGGRSSPTNPSELRTALVEGYAGRLILSNADSTVLVDGKDLDTLRLLQIDVSNAMIRPGYEPSQFKGTPRIQRSFTIQTFRFIAEPLKMGVAEARVQAHVSEADMQILADSKGQRGLLLLGASDGTAEFSMSQRDMEAGFLEASRRGAEKFGAVVDSTELSFRSPSSQALEFTARIRSRFLLVPVTFRVHGRMDVDDQMRATFSKVGCEGEDVGGAMVAAFMDPRMKKIEERISPLMQFPDQRTRLKWIIIDAENGLHIRVGFGK